MSKENKELYYEDQMRFLWLEYKHEPDLKEPLWGREGR
jgi:hypothetical protein